MNYRISHLLLATVVVSLLAVAILTQVRDRRLIGELRTQLGEGRRELEQITRADAAMDWLLRDEVTKNLDPGMLTIHLQREVAGYVLQHFEDGDRYDRLLDDPRHTDDFVSEALGMLDCYEASDLLDRCQSIYSVFPDDEIHGWALEIEATRLAELEAFFDRCLDRDVRRSSTDG